MPDLHRLLAEARVVALVDWRIDVPRTLVRAGFTVVSFNRLRNTAASYAWYADRDQVPASDDVTLFEPDVESEGFLICRPTAEAPAAVDILNVFRPAEELPDLARLAVHLGATALWVQPGSTSAEARNIAEAAGLAFIDGVDIAEAVRSAGIPLA